MSWKTKISTIETDTQCAKSPLLNAKKVFLLQQQQFRMFQACTHFPEPGPCVLSGDVALETAFIPVLLLIVVSFLLNPWSLDLP